MKNILIDISGKLDDSRNDAIIEVKKQRILLRYLYLLLVHWQEI